MKKAAIVFPHQLFENNPALKNTDLVYLVEENLFFNQYKFHKQKLIFHRASMKFYQDYLIKKNKQVIYIESISEFSDIRKLILKLKIEGIDEIHYVEKDYN